MQLTILYDTIPLCSYEKTQVIGASPDLFVGIQRYHFKLAIVETLISQIPEANVSDITIWSVTDNSFPLLKEEKSVHALKILYQLRHR